MLDIKTLPYALTALQPVISPETLSFHHDKHYIGYVNKANELLPKEWEHKSLEKIISLARGQENMALFNQVAQVWNHEFFFEGLSLVPEDHEISGNLLDLIRADYHDVENLKAELIKTALARFGSGWVWLVLDGGRLKVQSTANAETPCGLQGIKTLWTLDVWEHAYYLDYQNKRLDYATEVVNKAMNWRFICDNLNS